jgi:glycosyltransferase involved in cell wall biosynthesis
MTRRARDEGGRRRGPRSVLLLSWRDRAHPDAGGAEVYLDHVARALADRDREVTLFSARFPGAASEEVVDGVRIVRRGGRLTVYAWAAILYLAGRLGRPDAVVDVQNGLPFFASVWSRRPVVVLHHHAHERQWSIFFGPWLGRVGWWVESRLAPRLQHRARYVTVSGASRHDLRALGIAPDRIDVVHNGAEPLVPPADDRHAEPRLVVLGRLVPHKRVELAIDLVGRLRQGFPGLHLDVVGDGEWRAELEAYAAAQGVADAVTFHGHVGEDEKVRLLHRAWLMVLPSVKEGWGLAVMEAASLGVPTVAFRSAGGVTESILDGRSGALVDDGDELLARVADLLADGATRARLGAGARAHSRSFTWAATGARFDDVLTALVDLADRAPETVRSAAG